MKRLVLTTPDEDMSKVVVSVEEVPVPKPRSGELLIKVAAAPINPSDYGVWRNSKPERCPLAIGNEGSGVVVASGGGSARIVAGVGTKVGFVNLPKGQGAYSEYVTVSAMTGTFPLPADLEVELAASFFVNPYTVVGILDTVQQLGATGLVHTAAASQVGQMLVKLAKQRGVTLLNVVRRADQVATLRALGAEHVLDTSIDGWKEELSSLIATHKVTIAFDAIAGDTTGTLLSLLPNGGTCFVYGGLSRLPVSNVAPLELIYKRKEIKGWLLTNWLMGGGQLRMLKRLRDARLAVNPGLKPGGWAETRFVDCKLADVWGNFLPMYNTGGFTDAKLRVRFDGMNAGTDQAQAAV